MKYFDDLSEALKELLQPSSQGFLFKAKDCQEGSYGITPDKNSAGYKVVAWNREKALAVAKEGDFDITTDDGLSMLAQAFELESTKPQVMLTLDGKPAIPGLLSDIQKPIEPQ